MTGRSPSIHIHPLRVVVAWSICLYVGAVAAGLVEFQVWSQILDHPRETLRQIRWTTDAHALRYVLMLPVLSLSEWLRVDADRVFSFFVTALILLTARLLDSARVIATGDPRRWTVERAAITVFLLVLSLMMNGRLSFALCGMALLLWSQVSLLTGRLGNVRFCCWAALAQFLTAVSSGTFSVALAAWLVWGLFVVAGRLPLVRLRDLLVAAVTLAGAIALLPVLTLYMTKNVSFYGGGLDGFFKMLNHGPGVYLYNANPFVIVLLACNGVVAAIAMFFLLKRRPLEAPAILTVFCALSIGLFGYSTMAMGLPSLIFLVTRASTASRLARGSHGHAAFPPAIRAPKAAG